MAIKSLGSRAIIGTYYAKLEQYTGYAWIPSLANYFTSDQPSETYKWLGMAPGLQPWVGTRQAKGLRDNGMTIVNQKFESTLEFDKDDMRRDKTGQVMVRIADLAQRTNAHWGELLSTLILNGATNLCYDGQYFIDTDHSEGLSGIQSNKITCDISTKPTTQHGTPSAPSAEEMMYAILEAIQQILLFLDDQGKPMNMSAREFTTMVPVSLMAPAMAATRNTQFASGVTNTLTNSEFKINLEINPNLTANDTIHVFRTDAPVKPFLRQEELGVQMKAIAEGSEHEFKTNKHLYGVETNRNVGYGYWQYACQQQMT
jgi:phage major head subunit gpT-like protein